MRSLAIGFTVFVALGAACGGDSPRPLGPSDQAGLRATLDALAGFGNKHCGTPEAARAAEYIQGRFDAMKLTDIHTETFQFPKWELVSSTMSVSIDGVATSPKFEVFEASGGGAIDAPIVNAETATDDDLKNVDVNGKVALVIRNPSFHRAAQFRNVTAHGAVAMLYLSVAPQNLIQVGSVRFDWEAAGTIPAITIGADDGAVIKDAVVANKNVRAVMNVAVKSTPGVGTNVIGRIPGERPEMIVMGAHYDTWFAGSADNGGGVAELINVAERRMQRPKPRYTLVFVAYDGEEIGLYGGYDYLRKHKIIGNDPILAVMNFESPSANNPDIAGLVHSNQPALDDSLQEAALRKIYGVYAGLEIVAQLFGGIIPTDIQGTYRSGVPTVTTAVTNPYYHTTLDTPDTVDLQLLGDSSDGFDNSIDFIGGYEPADFAVADKQLWTADVTTQSAGALTVDATIKDANGVVQMAPAAATIMVDDFTEAATAVSMTDTSGHVTFTFPAAAAGMGKGNRFLHVTSGPKYPLVEKIVPLP